MLIQHEPYCVFFLVLACLDRNLETSNNLGELLDLISQIFLAENGPDCQWLCVLESSLPFPKLVLAVFLTKWLILNNGSLLRTETYNIIILVIEVYHGRHIVEWE